MPDSLLNTDFAFFFVRSSLSVREALLLIKLNAFLLSVASSSTQNLGQKRTLRTACEQGKENGKKRLAME